MDISSIGLRLPHTEAQIILSWVDINVRGRTHNIDGPNPVDRARTLAQAQQKYWSDAYSLASGPLNNAGVNGFSFRSDPTVSPAEKGATLSSEFPILLHSPQVELGAIKDKSLLAAAFIDLAASSGTKDVPSSLAMAARVAELKTHSLKDKVNDAVKEINAALKELDSSKFTKAARKDIESARQQFVDRTVELEATQKAIEQNHAKFAEQTGAMLAEARIAAIHEVEQVREALKQVVYLEAVITLWTKKTASHAILFGCGAFAFMGLVATSVAVSWIFGGQYIEAVITRAGDRQILASTLVAAPVLAVAWILRLVSRFMQTNLVLWQDAGQRKAAVQTYVSLTAEEKAGMTREERALALAALFRPTPGASIEDVSPPNLFDFVRGKPDG